MFYSQMLKANTLTTPWQLAFNMSTGTSSPILELTQCTDNLVPKLVISLVNCKYHALSTLQNSQNGHVCHVMKWEQGTKILFMRVLQ